MCMNAPLDGSSYLSFSLSYSALCYTFVLMLPGLAVGKITIYRITWFPWLIFHLIDIVSLPLPACPAVTALLCCQAWEIPLPETERKGYSQRAVVITWTEEASDSWPPVLQVFCVGYRTQAGDKPQEHSRVTACETGIQRHIRYILYISDTSYSI